LSQAVSNTADDAAPDPDEAVLSVRPAAHHCPVGSRRVDHLAQVLALFFDSVSSTKSEAATNEARVAKSPRWRPRFESTGTVCAAAFMMRAPTKLGRRT
jgi:hypothetical protein